MSFAAKRPQGPANRLRELREAAGLSMDELALRVSRRGHTTTASTINKLEKRHIKMTVEWLYRLSDALGVERWEIMEPVQKLAPSERELVAELRGLSEPDRAAVFQIVQTMKKAS